MRRLCALALLFAVPSLFATAPRKTVWRELVTPHFHAYYEANWAPAGLGVELEKIHGRMRMDISMFAPWMSTGTVKIYIHASQASFMAGEFAPPPWSRGLAYSDKKTIVIYDDGVRDRLRSVITHELAHLFFESFFKEADAVPPVWLNEGLAVYMEDRADSDKGPWSTALKGTAPARMKPLKTHCAGGPKEDAPAQQVSDWYLESFALVKFLFTPATRLQFKNLSVALRNGVPLEQTLWNVYRYRSLSAFEEAWRKWLFAPEGNAQSASGPVPSAPQFSPIQFKPFSMKN